MAQAMSINFRAAIALYVVVKQHCRSGKSPRARLLRQRIRDRYRGQKPFLKIIPTMRHTLPGTAGCRYCRKGRED